MLARSILIAGLMIAGLLAACAPEPQAVAPTPTPPGLQASPTIVLPTVVRTPASTSVAASPTSSPTRSPDGEDYDELQRAHAEAFGRWMTRGARDYQFNFRWTCFCAPSYVHPVKITVESESISDVRYIPGSSGSPSEGPDLEQYETVRGLFDLIQAAINDRAYRVHVEYGGEDGHPVSAYIDYVQNIADEEKGFEVSDLRFTGRDYAALQSDLEGARSTWASKAINNYHYVARTLCFCPPQITAPVVVAVNSGKVISVRYRDATAFQEAPDITRYKTVEGLFDEVQKSIDSKYDSVRVTYDPELGYLTRLVVDRFAMAVDDEYAIEAEGLVVR